MERFTDSELAVLLAGASRENISPDEFNRVIEDPDSVTIDLPEDEDTKLAYLRDMVALALLEGRGADARAYYAKLTAFFAERGLASEMPAFEDLPSTDPQLITDLLERSGLR